MCMLALLVSLYCYIVNSVSGSNSVTLAKSLLNWHATVLPHFDSDLCKAGVDTAQRQTTTTCLKKHGLFTINFIQNILAFLSLKRKIATWQVHSPLTNTY